MVCIGRLAERLRRRVSDHRDAICEHSNQHPYLHNDPIAPTDSNTLAHPDSLVHAYCHTNANTNAAGTYGDVHAPVGHADLHTNIDPFTYSHVYASAGHSDIHADTILYSHRHSLTNPHAHRDADLHATPDTRRVHWRL